MSLEQIFDNTLEKNMPKDSITKKFNEVIGGDLLKFLKPEPTLKAIQAQTGMSCCNNSCATTTRKGCSC